MTTALQRFTVHGQSAQCPDGYARTLYYVWDNDKDRIVLTDHERVICDGRAAQLNRRSAIRKGHVL